MISIIKYNISCRKGVFETNSSSMHSVTLTDTKIFTDNLTVYGDILEIPFDEFGWGYDEYNDADTKLSYLATLLTEICLSKRNMHSIDEIMETEDFQQIKSIIMENTKCSDVILSGQIEHHTYINQNTESELFSVIVGGYVDHQSYEDYDSIQDFLDDYGVSCYDFIFNPAYTLVISNDNG